MTCSTKDYTSINFLYFRTRTITRILTSTTTRANTNNICTNNNCTNNNNSINNFWHSNRCNTTKVSSILKSLNASRNQRTRTFKTTYQTYRE